MTPKKSDFASLVKEIRERGVGNKLSGEASKEVCESWEWSDFEPKIDISRKTILAWEAGSPAKRKNVRSSLWR